MAKPFKILLWILFSFVALIVVVAVALPLVLNPNNYKDEAAQATKEATGRELHIDGDIKLTIFPWLGVSVSGVRLDNAKGFGPEPFAEVAEVNVAVRLMPLLTGRRVEVSKVRVEGVSLNLAKKKDGTNNWSDLGEKQAEEQAAPEKPARPPAKPAGKPTELYVGGVEIKNVTFSYTDQQTGEAYKVADLSLETGPIKPPDPIGVVIGFIVKSAQPQLESDVKISFTALSGGEQVLELNDLKVDTTSKGPAVPGGSQTASLRGRVRHDEKAGTFAFTDGVLQAAGLTLYATVNGDGLNGDAPRLSGKLATNTFNPKELAASFGAALPPTADPRALTQASLDASIAGDPANARLENLTLKLDQTTANGGLTIRNLSDPVIDFALKADSFDADRYLAPPTESKASGDAGGGDFKKTPIPVDALDAVNATGTVDLNALKLKGLNFTKIHIDLAAKKGQAKTQQMTALLYGGKITQTARLTHNSPWKYDLKVGLDAVNSAPLLKDMVGKSFLSGLGDFNLNVSSGGATVGDVLQALSGNVGASFSKGALEGFNLSQTLESAKATLRGEAAPASDEPKRTEFKDLKAAGKIKDGVLDTDTLDIKGTWYQLGGDGKVNLVEQTLDYTLMPTFTSDKHKDLAGMKVPITVSGSWYAPKVKVDLGGALKGKAKEEIKKQEEKVKAKAVEKLGDFLRKKAPPPKPAEPAPAETKPAEPAPAEAKPAEPAPATEPKPETPPPSGG